VQFVSRLVRCGTLIATIVASHSWATCVSNGKTLPLPPMVSGPYYGQCLDLNDKLPVTYLSATDGVFTVANFYHDKHFWIAKIKKSSIQSVVFQIVEFPAGIMRAAHTQFKFVTGPIQLERETANGKKTYTIVRNFVTSYEYIAPVGIDYEPVEGTFNYFGIVGRVMSEATSIADQQGRRIYGPTLQLQPAFVSVLAYAAFEESRALALTSTYNTVELNCTTEIFKVLDDALTYRSAVTTFHVGISLDPVVGPSLQALMERGLIP
jgi:hypothetical protein